MSKRKKAASTALSVGMGMIVAFLVMAALTADPMKSVIASTLFLAICSTFWL